MSPWGFRSVKSVRDDLDPSAYMIICSGFLAVLLVTQVSSPGAGAGHQKGRCSGRRHTGGPRYSI